MAENHEYVKDYAKRLQRVVSKYEHSIVEHLNTEYSKQTR